MTIALYLVGITVMWVLAWGSLSVANVLGGIAVACFLLIVSPDRLGTGGRITFRPLRVVRFAAFVLAQVVTSNVLLVRAVVARRSRLHTGVMAVPLPECSDTLLTIVTNVMALTPGTTPLHVTRYPTVLYVHVLDMREVAATRRGVQRLADLAFRGVRSRGDGREQTVIGATYLVLAAAFVCFAYRLVRGPSLADRVIAIDGMLMVGLGMIVVQAEDTGRGAFLQVAVMLALVGFIGTAVVARFIEGQGE